MTSKTKDEIKAFFQTGDKPTESQFIDFIDSYVDKSGTIGTLEAALLANPTGVVIAAIGVPSVAGYSTVRTSMGITVYDSSTAISAVAGSYATTAQATEIASAAANTYLTDILVLTATAAGASQVDIALTSAGYAYDIDLSSVTFSTNQTNLLLRTSPDGVTFDSAATDYSYYFNALPVSGSTPTASRGDNNNSSVILISNISSTSGQCVNGRVSIENPYDQVNQKTVLGDFTYFSGDTALKAALATSFGQRHSTSEIKSIRLLPSGGTMSGVFYVRRRKK